MADKILLSILNIINEIVFDIILKEKYSNVNE